MADSNAPRPSGNSRDKLRERVLKRDGYVCQDCGQYVGDMNGPLPTGHMHHETPRSEGGSDDLDNLVTLCRECHEDRHESGVTPDATDTSKFGSPLDEHPNWKGGRTVTSHGYVRLKRPEHPDADVAGYVYEHRLVAENKLGRRIKSDEHVHHKNGDTTDNRPENLEIHHETVHRTKHRNGDTEKRDPGESNPEIECACGCGETLRKYDEWGRPRERLNGHTDYAVATPAKDDIMSVLREDGPIHRKDLADAVGRSLNGVSTHLSELRNDGRAKPVGDGEWDLAE